MCLLLLVIGHSTILCLVLLLLLHLWRSVLFSGCGLPSAGILGQVHFNEVRMSATKPNSPVWMARLSLSATVPHSKLLHHGCTYQ